MRKNRTLYYNDARHHYLFVVEPPMNLEKAWQPVDDIAGTSVDTLVYAVARRDGLFYPSKVGMRFGSDILPFKSANWWRAWHNMQSLIDQDLDPLKVLIDRAGENKMEFFACLRVGAFGEMDAGLNVRNQGFGYRIPQVRDHALACAVELAQDYQVDGIELDFTDPSGPASSSLLGYFEGDVLEEYRPVMTEWVAKVSKAVKNRNGNPGILGARVYPTEAVNLGAGLEIRTWLQEEMLDYVVPNIHGARVLHQNMDIDWMIELAHEQGVSVYPLLHPMYQGDKYATLDMMRAAFFNYRTRGVDGLYTWALNWPHGEVERNILVEQGTSESFHEDPKHYFVPKRLNKVDGVVSYESELPLAIDSNSTGVKYEIPLYISNQLKEGSSNLIRLRLFIRGLVNADYFVVYLNGASIMGEASSRYFHDTIPQEVGRWVEFVLDTIQPQSGNNVVGIELLRRGVNDLINLSAAHGTGLIEPFIVEEVEMIFD